MKNLFHQNCPEGRVFLYREKPAWWDRKDRTPVQSNTRDQELLRESRDEVGDILERLCVTHAKEKPAFWEKDAVQRVLEKHGLQPSQQALVEYWDTLDGLYQEAKNRQMANLENITSTQASITITT